jgi:uncharacterized protein (TIGR02246 family)
MPVSGHSPKEISMASHPPLQHPLQSLIQSADRAITAEDFDALMDFYTDDAVLVVKPGLNVAGKAAIRAAFVRIAEFVGHSLQVGQGRMEVLESEDTALVIMESTLDYRGPDGVPVHAARRATYVFRRGEDGSWLCAIDNSYGTALLDA